MYNITNLTRWYTGNYCGYADAKNTVATMLPIPNVYDSLSISTYFSFWNNVLSTILESSFKIVLSFNVCLDIIMIV